MHRCNLDAPGRTSGKRRLAPLLLTALALLLRALPADAAQTRHLHWRQPQQIAKLESLKVEDVPGHAISLGESHGRAIFKNGEVASVNHKYIADYTRGTGPFWGYSTITFKDRSKIYAKYRMYTALGPDGRTTHFRGTFTFTRGTGRFRGIRGSGTCTGRRFVTHARQAWLELENDATYRLARR